MEVSLLSRLTILLQNSFPISNNLESNSFLPDLGLPTISTVLITCPQYFLKGIVFKEKIKEKSSKVVPIVHRSYLCYCFIIPRFLQEDRYGES